MHHIRLKTHRRHFKHDSSCNTDNKETRRTFDVSISAVTYMSGGEDEQRPPGRDQHLGLCEVTDALFLQLHHVTHQGLHILGPVLVSPRAGELLQPVLQWLLQGTAAMTRAPGVSYDT